MIKFFRKIRQKLLEQNRVSKYLIYAFGEIILVVIGILIALQINNWNENRIQKTYERKMLHELVDDLKLDTTMINYQFKRIEFFTENVDLAIKKLKNSEMLNADEINLFGGIYFIQNTKAIETIKSGNIQIPFDDELRKKISEHYHKSNFYLDLVTLEDDAFYTNWSRPIQKKYFTFKLKNDSKEFDYEIIIKDKNELDNNLEFEDFLIKRKNRTIRWNWAYTKVRESSITIIKAIEQYLNIRND